MDALVQRQVERLHGSETTVVVVVAGGGSRALSWLLGVPGASRTVLEVLVPYAPAALADYLGYRPQQVVALETARDMARIAYERARFLGTGGAVAGIGSTAALATDRPKRGAHRSFISGWAVDGVTTYALTLVKGLRDRAGEDEVISRLLLRALADVSSVDFDLPLSLDARERLDIVTQDHRDAVERFVADGVKSVTIHADGAMAAEEQVRGGVLAGSFDPLHEGHEELARVAEENLGADVTFELSIANVDKPLLEETEVRRRIAQFAGKGSVVITRAATFIEKARLFPGCTFVIGWDTAMRLVDPRYYGGAVPEMVGSLTEMRRLRCRILVAGREQDGVFHTLENVPVPADFVEMFTPIPEEAFRHDASSTRLRVSGSRP